jgi:hypothetical protein
MTNPERAAAIRQMRSFVRQLKRMNTHLPVYLERKAEHVIEFWKGYL